jgi:hypothetical protein
MEIPDYSKLTKSADMYWVYSVLAVLCYWYAYQL